MRSTRLIYNLSRSSWLLSSRSNKVYFSSAATAKSKVEEKPKQERSPPPPPPPPKDTNESSEQSSMRKSKSKYDELKEKKASEVKTGVGVDKEIKKVGFVKDLFLGRFDTDLMTYPEVLPKDQVDILEGMVKQVEKFYNEKVDSKKIDAEAKIPDEIMKGLKELGLFGQQIPVEYGGLGLNATEYARLQEVISYDGGIGVTLAAHQAIGLKGLLLYGTDEQKKKYLPRLASGEMIAAFCLTEPSAGSDAASVKTKAKLHPDGSKYILNGSKLWISNGGIADFFTVFATSDDDNVTSTRKVTAFAVERSFGGITSGKPEDKLGIRGSNTCEVHFDNTPVPIENVIGEVGGGFKIAVNILNSGRFSMGSAGAGFMKKLIGWTTEHAINRKQFNRPLSEFGLIREKLAQMSINTYVMESMAYLTAGLIDNNEYADCALESAIVKVFSSEACWHNASECLQILGGLGYMKDYPYERVLRDSRILLIFEGTNEILRLFIALSGVQHAGKALREEIIKARNPFSFPTYAYKKFFERLNDSRNTRKLTLHLEHYLHPSLANCAELLEHSLMRFRYGVELLLQEHGAKIVDAQVDLCKLANIVIDLYAITAVLSRASRSYCIGLKKSELEMHMAIVFTKRASLRITREVESIQMGKIHSQDIDMQEIGEMICADKGYIIAHPLSRTYW